MAALVNGVGLAGWTVKAFDGGTPGKGRTELGPGEAGGCGGVNPALRVCVLRGACGAIWWARGLFIRCSHSVWCGGVDPALRLRVTCGGFGAACERRRRFWAARGVEAGHVIHKSRAQRAM